MPPVLMEFMHIFNIKIPVNDYYKYPLKNQLGFSLEYDISVIVQELAIKKRHQAYRIAAIVHIARLKPKS